MRRCMPPSVAAATRLSSMVSSGLPTLKPIRRDQTGGLDHDDFGSNRSKIMNVINSNILERDAGGKPLHTFPHPALAAPTPAPGSRGRAAPPAAPGPAPARPRHSEAVELDELARLVKADQVAHPAEHRDVGDRVVVAHDPLAARQTRLQHAEQPLRSPPRSARAGACPRTPCRRTC